MKKFLLDTDVLVDCLREYRPALDWLESLDEAPLVSGFVVFELFNGCRNKSEQDLLRKKLGLFNVQWPAVDDLNRALEDVARFHLSHKLEPFDAIIGETAVGLDIPLCTFNEKHYSAIPSLLIRKPYRKGPEDKKNGLPKKKH